MDQGYIKLYRQLKKNWLWQEKRTFSKAEAWIDILLMVNHSDNKTPCGKELVLVKKGSRMISVRQLCDRWNWSNTKVINFLNLLQKDGMITYKSDTKKTVLSVVNWELYQTNSDTKATQKHHASDTQATRKHTNNNDNNENNEKNDKEETIYTPYQKIKELYHSKCPSFPKIRDITPAREQAIKRIYQKYNGIAVFEELFEVAEGSDFLSGRSPRDSKHLNFKADFDWLITEKNTVKVLEGKYNNRPSSQKSYDDIPALTFDKPTMYATKD